MTKNNIGKGKDLNLDVSLPEFKQFMFDRTVPVQDLKDHKGGSLEKVLAYWRRNGLLPFIGEGKWLKISFAQLIWLRILDSLREISFPVEKMKIVCDYFFKDAYDDDLPKKNIEYNRKEILMKKKAGNQSEEDEQLLSYLEDFLQHKPFLYALKFDVNYLTNLIINSISNGKDATIWIYFNGQVAEYLDDKLVSHKDVRTSPLEPHIRLSITHYLNEFIENDALATLLMPQLLNDDEKKVLREMRRKNVKEIVIYNNKSGEPRRIESTKAGVLTLEDAKQVKQLLGLKNYERITLDTLDEKSLSFKMTRKKI